MHAYGQFVHPLGCKILSVAYGHIAAVEFLVLSVGFGSEANSQFRYLGVCYF